MHSKKGFMMLEVIYITWSFFELLGIFLISLLLSIKRREERDHIEKKRK